MPSNVTTLRTRKPSGAPSYPLILLAGEAKTGKTWQLAEFTGDERVGRSFVLDLGEGTGDEYGAVPGADYELVDHDGTWIDIIGQVEAVAAEAAKDLAAGLPPVVLGIDSMTTEWGMLTRWTNERAKRSASNRRLLAQDADAEIDVSSNYWNDANARHQRLMDILKTFPGIVVITALETEKTQFGPGGRPLEGAPKVAKPDGQKRLAADSSVWIRLSLTEEPVVVGMRSVKRSIIPGKDQPKPWAGFTLAALVFEELGIASGTAAVRNLPTLTADQVDPSERVAVQPGDQRQQGAPAGQTVEPPAGQTARERKAAETDRARKAGQGVDAILAADSLARAEELAGVAAKSAAAQLDILGLLEGRDVTKENLGITGGPVTLAAFAASVAAYWKGRGESPVPTGSAGAGQDPADEKAVA